LPSPITTTDAKLVAAKEASQSHAFQSQLHVLRNMGLGNEELNTYLLGRHNGNIQTVLDFLLPHIQQRPSA